MSATLFVYNQPAGLDGTHQRRIVYGNAVINGTYISGGLVPNWNSLTFANGDAVELDAKTTGNVAVVNTFGVTSNVVTIGASNYLTNGQYVAFNGLTGNAAVLNGQTLLVSAASSNAFQVSFTAANQANSAVSGSAVTVIGPDSFHIESVAGSGITYGYNKANATIQCFNSNVEIANGSNISANVGVDTTEFKAEYLQR